MKAAVSSAYDAGESEAGSLWRSLSASRWLLGLFAAALVFNAITLLRTPAPFVDDAWFASRAWALIHTGQPFSTLDSGVSEWFPGYWVCIPWLGTWLQSLSVRLFGVGLFSIRLVSFVFGLALLGAIYSIARHLGGVRLGLLAALLTALSREFLYSSHLGRPDIIVAAFGFGAIACCITDGGPRLTVRSILCGLAAGLAVEIHPNGMIYTLPIVALHGLDHGRGLLRAKRFWGFVLGEGVALVFYLAIHVAPYPQTFFSLNSLIYGPTHTPPVLVADPGLWLRSFVDVLARFLADDHLRTPLVVVAFVTLLRRRSPADNRLLTPALALLAAFALLVRYKHPHYAILAAPALELVLAAFLIKMAQDARVALAAGNARIRAAQVSLAALTVGLLVLAVAADLTVALPDPTGDFQAVLSGVRETLPAEAVVMGPQTYWLAVPGQTYLSWEQLVYYQRFVRGSDLATALRALRPEFLIIDRDMEDLAIADDRAELTSYGQLLYLPKADLERFLGERARLARTIATTTFGPVRIYELDWSHAGLAAGRAWATSGGVP